MTRKTARTSSTDVARTPDTETSTELHGSPRPDLARGSARLPRREPTDEERARARDLAPKIRASRELGFSPSQIGSKWRLPAQAIEEVLAAPKPSAPDRHPGPAGTGSDGAALPEQSREGLSHEFFKAQLDALDDELRPRTRSARTSTVPGSRADPLDLDTTGNPLDRPAPAVREPATVLYRVLLDGGIPDGRARLVGRYYRATSMEDWAGLRSFMVRAGIPAQKSDVLIEAFRLEGGFAVPDVGDSSLPSYGAGLPTDQVAAERARLRREKLEQLEDLRLDAMLRQLNPVAQMSGSSPEIAELRAALAAEKRVNDELRSREHDRALLEAFDARLAPLRQDLDQLKTRPAAPTTQEQALVAGTLSSISGEAEMRKVALDVARNKLETPGPIRVAGERLAQSSLVDALADQGRKILQSTSPVEHSQAPPMEDLEREAAEAQARLAAIAATHAGTDAVQQPEAPRASVPGE